MTHKILEPNAAAEAIGWIGASTRATQAIVAAMAAVESAVAVSLLLDRGRSCGRVAAAVLVAYAAGLVIRGVAGGWTDGCSCFGFGLPSTVSGALARNVLMAASAIAVSRLDPEGAAVWGAPRVGPDR